MDIFPANIVVVVCCGSRIKYRSEGFKTACVNALRASLVLLTAAVASGAPYFGTVLGRVGGLTDALQAFVLPPLIFLHMHRGHLSLRQRAFHSFVLVWGVCTMLYTLTQIYFNMMDT